MKLLYTLIITMLYFPIASQNHDYVWLFGYNYTSSLPGIEGSIGDFKQQPFGFEYINIGIPLFVSNAIVSDSTGHLKFYTNACSIANSNHEIMENGEGINPGKIHETYCDNGYIAGTQGCLILPKPGNPDLYYVFHKHIITTSSEIITDALLYSMVDISLNNGMGKVIQKNQPLVETAITYSQLTAVKHANGKDWWILTGGDQNNLYYTFLLDSNGLDPYFTQSIGSPSSYNGSRGGQAVFSPDGSKYARYSATDGVFLFDFDRANGLLSNFRHIPIGDPWVSGGVAISPNSRFLYVSSTLFVYQYDLWAQEIIVTKDTVAIYDNFQAPFPTTFYTQQLAPDCKIYINSQNGSFFLHVIHNPDEPGLSCNLEQHGVPLPYPHQLSMPNFPNYRLGPLIPGETPAPPCSPIVSTEEPLPAPEPAIKVFPNPASGQFTIRLTAPAAGEWQLFHADGRLALRQFLSAGVAQYEIAVSQLPPGMYFYRVFLEGQPGGSGKVSVVR